MTIRYNKAAATNSTTAQYITCADTAGLTFPNGDWCVGFVVVFDGVLNGDNTTGLQYLFSTGPYQTAGSFHVVFYGSAATNPGVGAMIAGAGNPSRLSNMTHPTAGQAFQIVAARVGTSLVLRACPVLGTSPVNGSSVITNTYAAAFAATTLDGTQGLRMGCRGDASVAVARMADQSMGRFFRYDGQLTDLEVARLAYGEELSDLSKTPVWYSRQNDNTDFADQTATFTFTKNGTPANGTDPGFGFVAPVIPVFTTAPAIIGTPQEGVASAYTPGTASGTAATTTQQWYIDGSPVSGATSATYTPVTGDVTKSLTVVQTLTNTAGSDSEVSAGKTVTAAAAIGVTDLTANRIYQRIGTSVDIPITITYTGATPDAIEAQLYASDGTTVLQAWTALTSTTIGSGNGTGTLTANQGGMYRLCVRTKTLGVVIATSAVQTNLWGVGALFPLVGSSTTQGWMANAGLTIGASTVC